MIKNFIFDVGGVLITPSEKVTPFIISQMYAVPLEHAVNHYNNVLKGLRNGQYSIRSLMEDLKKKHLMLEEIPDPESVYAQYYERQAVVNEEVMEIIYSLKDKYNLIAFSNMSDLHAKINRQRQLFRYFNHIFLSSETGLVKPSEEAFSNLIESAKIVAGECVIIDDKEENIKWAIELGMEGVLFENPLHLKGYLQKNGLL